VPSFADYQPEKWKWITPFDVGFYPDHFSAALEQYRPTINRFRRLAARAPTSADLLRSIRKEPAAGRVQFLRIFRRFVSPVTSVEMLKRVGDTDTICTAFAPLFRDIQQVRANIGLKKYDIILSALLYEHKDRGNMGYLLTGKFFAWFEGKFGTPPYEALGPRGAGADVELQTVFEDYPHRCPCDIVIRRNGNPLVVGFARYDSDRGGSQEDDRTGGNQTKVIQILAYANEKGIPLKIFFLNDGPGLLLGSMWRDYGELEHSAPGRVMVATLKMLDERFTEEWLLCP
jgi:hypothetical protein